jgi:hypothetical protein
MIRELRPDDLEKLKFIHEKYYKEEFNFPDFSRHFLCAYVVERNGKIITAGGIRTIIECITITDKDLSVRERRDGLGYILNASRYFTKRNGYNELHCFVQDNNWMKHLLDSGFTTTAGISLVTEV